MKPTLKSINANLPRLDTLRNEYMLLGQDGDLLKQRYLAYAVADLDDDMNVDRITIYAVGDAMEADHYYGSDRTVNITDQIARVLSGERYAEYGSASAKKYRALIVDDIRLAILSALDD